MTLEDFFTLTEMKDGLTAPSRVQELVAVMKKEKDVAVKNVSDAIRQWAAVASTISATENKDCLDLFIQLDGLWFINRWLNDAQKFGNDTSDGFVEESITALLRALEKLQLDKESSFSSGIWVTVNNLLDHNSPRVQDRAKALFDSWKKDKIGDETGNDVSSAKTIHSTSVHANENTRVDGVDVDSLIAKGNVNLENNAAESLRDENLLPRNSNCPQQERHEDVKPSTHSIEVPAKPVLDTNANIEDRSQDHLIIPNTDQDSLSLKEKSLSAVEGNASTNSAIFPVPKGHQTDFDSHAPKKVSNFFDKSSVATSPSSKVESGDTVCVETASAPEIVIEQSVQINVDAKKGDYCRNDEVSRDVGTSLSALKLENDAIRAINTQVSKSTTEDGEHSPEQNLSAEEDGLKKAEDLRISFSQTGDIKGEDDVADDDREHDSDETDDSGDDSDFSRPPMDDPSPRPTERRSSNIDVEYGIVDALEVARQVAQEVEREVVDYKEPSCSSSSGKISDSGMGQPCTPDSISVRQDQTTEVPPDNEPTRQHHSTGAFHQEEGQSDNVDNEAENGTLESSQVTEVAQEPEVNTDKGLCGFDLNQEVCSEDIDHPVNPISTPVSVVSASRPAVASGSPSAPLQFEGTLGWKGSAATSAFRPASPRKASDVDKTLEMGGTSRSSKQKQGCLDFDLNVAGGADERTMDLVSERLIQVSSGPHSGESSLEVGPRRLERPNLDLNQISDDGDAPLELRMEGHLFYPPNGIRSPSPASSSSSMQPLRNFDLNDRPFFHNDSTDQGLYLGKSSQNLGVYGGSKPSEPVISIMGTKVEVGNRVEFGRKDFIPQGSSLPNGKPLEHVMDANMARMGGVLGMVPAVSYTPSPVFGYSGLAAAPNIPASSTMYAPGGSIPFMVDPRGAPGVHPLVASASTVSPYSQPPFIMSMGGAALSLNGPGPSRPNFDLNSGISIEGGSGGLRQLFMPSQGRSMEDHLRASSLPSSSGVGEKRKEPDGGWEHYSLHYKHPQPQPQPPWR